jgi:HAMP domain-containing protein/signal transduction histidine kinase/CheY-like chemotaxis protein
VQNGTQRANGNGKRAVSRGGQDGEGKRLDYLLRALRAAERGDFSVRLDEEGADGVMREIAASFNAVVERNDRLTREIVRVEEVVGREGRMKERASLPGAQGGWATGISSFNALIGDLVQPTTEVARVINAVAAGDLTHKMVLEIEGQPVKGEFLRIGTTVNAMVAQLRAFAAEVTRVAREVGTDGKLGGQAAVPEGAGIWRDLTDNVNQLAANLTAQVRNIADVTTSVAKGDLSKKITVDARGEVLELKNTVNTMVDQLNSFAAEVTRVAREVGTDGKLGGQAEVKGVSGAWKDLTDNVNFMASNLTAQVRNIADVTTSVAKGDLSKKITVDAKGEVLELKNTINTMVDQLNSFAAEVTRVAKEVGTDGKLGGQAHVRGVSGVWKDLTDNVNSMATNLTTQVRGIVKVVTAVANGDLAQKLAVEAKGEIAALGDTLNGMTNTLRIFAQQVTSVARTVGVEGKLGAQADVPGVSGVWKELTDNVNLLANNLTNQVRNIAKVTTAVAFGDLSQKISVDVSGEVLELKNTINTMVDQLRSFAAEVTRVAREVGTEGKLGGQAQVPGVSGTWKDLTDNVNLLANNLTDQVRNIAKVTTAVAYGDLSQKISVDVKGEVLELKNTINTMVDQLRSFAAEVTRVGREVGTEGKLGGQAQVHGVSGTWKDLTDNVNLLANNLTEQVRNIAQVTTAIAKGDLSKKITVDVKGEILELKNTINTLVDQLNSFASEVTRVAREVGTEGRLGGQAEVQGVAGTWKNLTDNVNFMASNLTTQVRGIVKVVTAVANGDLRQKLSVDAKGEVAALAETINNMTEALGVFAEQVSTVAREVGVEGKLGGQARVPGVAGTWKDLTDNVNFMASNLTTQVRGIARLVTSVAKGDLQQKLVGVEAKGEIAALADTINDMTETLGTFADQVSTVAREVGIEGKLGGQAKVPGAAGTWKDLTDNVNQLAGNLTAQVRAISDVATAVTKGDLTQSITVEAEGEVAALKDNINQMIVNLKETTAKNTEQDWLKTNLAKFSGMMQGLKTLEDVSQLIMSRLTPLVSAHHGAFFMLEQDGDVPTLKLSSSYAYRERKGVANRFRLGEGLIGQCAREKETILLTRVPSDYIQINSGLGEAPPLNIIVLPVLFEGQIKAVIELASFHPFSTIHQIFLDQLKESIGVVLNMISANMRTEELLEQSQGLTQELQKQSQELTEQQEELKRTNAALEKQALELEEKAKQLAEQNVKVEVKNQEVEQARLSLEEKAEQLALISKYKSEFLANMSHELRTPLNSLLILAKLLADNKEHNLDEKQVDYAKTIYASGGDLLTLINEILDLSKVEAGKMQVEARTIPFSDTREFVERSFAPVADEKRLRFSVRLSTDLPDAMQTDPQRLQQVLKNLLANAFKFTEVGSVELSVFRARGTRFTNEALERTPEVIGFSVIDTGVGIAKEKQKIIFEEFQQADGTTSRKYGGTGLGLSISRQIARLLGGEIQVQSELGKGSTFTLYLPRVYVEPPTVAVAQRSPAEVTVPSLPPRRKEEATFEDDREHIRLGDRVLLVIEDDLRFADIMMTAAREKGFKVVVANRGDTGLALANELCPAAITLDIKLPMVDGWSILDRLKRSPRTRHIPVHVISVLDRKQGAALGAFAYLEKPVSRDALEGAFSHIATFLDRKVRRLLLLESDAAERHRITSLLDEGEDLEVVLVDNLEDALARVEAESFDCMVVDLLLPGDGVRAIEEIKERPRLHDLPIIVYTNRELSDDERVRLRRCTESVIRKGGVKSVERLVSDTVLFLHRVEATLPDPVKRILREIRDTASSLAGRRILIVDDDVRNIFAMTSVLESHGMEVIFAENGRAGIEMLERNPSVDLVLMDIMMPGMDGYETMRAIRSDGRFESVPMIAVTAKALKEDRDKCINAGASDYLPKPVEEEKLLELIRLWVTKAPDGVTAA